MKLIIPVLLCPILVLVLCLIDRRLKKPDRRTKQIIIGILFGILAIISSETGITYGDMIVNVRDAAPLSAGLIFGAPAGIISGLIGGIYRFFLGSGDYTRLACSISTILIGFLSALLRKLMFDDKKPTILYGVGIACVAEDIHMLLIFLLNLDDAATAFSFVRLCTIPMVIGNAVAVGLSMLAVTFVCRDKTSEKQRIHGNENITETFGRWLFVCVIIAYFLTSMFTYRLQTSMASTQVRGVVVRTVEDVYNDILDTSDANLLEKTNKIEREYYRGDDWTSETLLDLAERNDVAGINIIGSDGIIRNSSIPEFIGYDIRSGEQSAEFTCLFEGETSFVQKYQPLSYDSSISRKYAGVLLYDGSVLQVGYSYDQYKKDIDDLVYNATKNRHIGNSGFIMICDDNDIVVADGDVHNGMLLSEIGLDPQNDEDLGDGILRGNVKGTPYIYSCLSSEGYRIIGAIPESEANYMRDASIYISVLIEIIIFAFLFVMVYFLVKRVIINNLRKINESLSRITGGDLNEKVNVRSNVEFASLSDDINSTVSTLKRYIAEAASRIDRELEYARQIQTSALPNSFPPFPDDKRFDIYATMHTAKEVGGDFYDFYLLDNDRVAFLIADVSGKGIPASLFMMRAKTTIKDLAESGFGANDILTMANEKLCEGNEAGMFVTVFIGILDLTTGILRFSNAGHNPPLILHKGSGSEFLRAKPGFVLGGMEGVRYRLNELSLKSGDRIFLYTDGVTEAADNDQKLFGEERLKSFMDSHPNEKAEALLRSLAGELDRYADGAPQADDITMLMLDYYGGGENGKT